MRTHTLKIKKVKRQETDGKPDTYSVNAECETAAGLSISLTVASTDREDLKNVISTVPGDLVFIRLEPVQYGDITTYGQAVRSTMEELSGLEKNEADRLIKTLATLEISNQEEAEPEDPAAFKAPDVNVLIEELKDFNYSDHRGSVEKVKNRLAKRGYSIEGLDQALGQTEPEAMQEDPYREARRAAWQAQDKAEKDARELPRS